MKEQLKPNPTLNATCKQTQVCSERLYAGVERINTIKSSSTVSADTIPINPACQNDPPLELRIDQGGTYSTEAEEL